MGYSWKNVWRNTGFGSLGVLLILTLFFSGMFVSCGSGGAPPDDVDSTAILAPKLLFGICVDSLAVETGRVERNQTLSSILFKYGCTSSVVYQLGQVADSVIKVGRDIRVGQPYTALLTSDSIRSLRYLVYEKSDVEYVVFDLNPERYQVYSQKRAIRVEVRHVSSAITSSLWNAVVDDGGMPELALDLSDIYAWQIDFFGIAKGDSFSVVYDELYVDTLRWRVGDIRAAYFKHQGKEYYAFPFMEEDSVRIFFDENGQSLRKAFLKAPLKFSRISSGYTGSRYHPVLKIFRAHYGIDYAAATGTPIRSIGDGVVIRKAYQRTGGGHYLYIKHNSTYTTSYMHMSRYAAGINIGTRVSQGQVIGYVGQSGLATGPHLDFRVYKNGSPMNPLKMESPPTNPVKKENMERFIVVRDSLMKELKKF